MMSEGNKDKAMERKEKEKGDFEMQKKSYGNIS